jgi:L-iduronidase
MTFVNDESDPEEGWNKPRDWRADTRYAALMAKTVIHHLDAWINTRNSSAITSGLRYSLLSFDNAFLNYNLNSSSVNVFDQRTMVARFQMNESEPYRAETIRKQSINAHALLGLLGDKQLPLSISPSGGSDGTHSAPLAPSGSNAAGLLGPPHQHAPLPWAPPTTDTMALASSTNGEQLTVLVATGDALPSPATATAQHRGEGGNISLRLAITNILPAISTHGGSAAIFVLGASPGASELWDLAARPAYPSPSLLRQMRAVQELAPVRVEKLDVGADYFVTQLELPSGRGGLALVHICPDDASKPVPPPTALASHSVSPDSTLISWQHAANACVRTFVVEDAATGMRLNAEDQIFMSWQLEHKSGSLPPKISVRAVNYAGVSSAPALLPQA